MNVKCPKCGRIGYVEDSLVGKNVECGCGTVFSADPKKEKKPGLLSKNLFPDKTNNGFETPAFARILNMVGWFILILGVIVGIFGIICGAPEGILILIPIGFFGSLTWFFCAWVIFYLAEIAFNTRQK